MQVTANGIAFNCRLDGPEGAPWLVFSNSLATDMGMWDGEVAQLQDRYRILRYDTLGHGGTAAGARPTASSRWSPTSSPCWKRSRSNGRNTEGRRRGGGER